MRRIPLVVIHAIKNSQKTVLSFAQQIIQTTAKFFSRDFARVTGTDRCDDVSQCNPAFQAI